MCFLIFCSDRISHTTVTSCVQLSRLLKELKEAKEAQNPEVRLLCSLERKILNMELRHQHREKELQQVEPTAHFLLGNDKEKGLGKSVKL